jgi:prepilin-type N-terminal cleavage/methylation domain-containing protein
MNCPDKRLKKVGGFTLIELAVTLAIMGVFAFAMFTLVPSLRGLPVFTKVTASTLNQAEAALNGFILTRGRLPCPDTSPNNLGEEDCTGLAIKGWLPVRTLGLSLTEPVRYGVYRAPNATAGLDGDLAVLTNRYQPNDPGTLPTLGAVVLTAPITLANGLDTCIALLNVTNAITGTVLTAGPQSVRIAYGLAVAGPKGSAFDGLNASADKFELAGTPKSGTYDDDTRTLGSAELFTRLGCANRLSATHSSAMALYASVDLDRAAIQYVAFRDFQKEVSALDRKVLDTAIVLAGVDVALAAVDLAIGIVGGFESFGDVLGVIGGTAAVIMAALALQEALDAVPAAEADAKQAEDQFQAATNFRQQTFNDVVDALQQTKNLDVKGLRQ